MDEAPDTKPETIEPFGSESTEPVDATDLLELILSEAPKELAPARIDGVVVGRIVAMTPKGEPCVSFAENPTGAPLVARSIAPATEADVGREVALLFESGDPERPILMGLMFAPRQVEPLAEETEARAETAFPAAPPEVERDGERLVFSAEREIVLRCGNASITLTRAGKILIRGAYLLARSSGVNRIQGGSVQIN